MLLETSGSENNRQATSTLMRRLLTIACAITVLAATASVA
jgi:hypothetical protein